MRQIELIGSEDERQLDGSRHIEIAGDTSSANIALRFVVDRDGSLQEAELSLELEGTFAVIGFDQHADVESDERLSVYLRSPEGEAEVVQRDDGDISLKLTMFDLSEPGE